MCLGLVGFGGILCDVLMVGLDGNNASIIVGSDVGRSWLDGPVSRCSTLVA